MECPESKGMSDESFQSYYTAVSRLEDRRMSIMKPSSFLHAVNTQKERTGIRGSCRETAFAAYLTISIIPGHDSTLLFTTLNLFVSLKRNILIVGLYIEHWNLTEMIST